MKYIYTTALLCIVIHASIAQVNLTQNRFEFNPGLPYDTTILSPTDALGYEPGEAFTLYHQVVSYFETLDNLSDRITVAQYGETYEDRPLIYSVITSPANHNQLETLRKQHLRITDPQNTPTEVADSLGKQLPVVVSFSYNIHGNEPSTTEAAMQVAYRLCAAQDQETLTLLDSVIFILYPCINPDGRDRYVYWYRSMRRNVPAIEPIELEHDAPWPLGRTNHYWFDLNRDWIWGIHPESRGHINIYQQWMPQVHVDYHEQGYNDNYFTAPGTTPRNMLLPESYEDWAELFGQANIDTFDAYQISYFTREAFDFFYPGYGSSYPSIMGAVGMLTEQGGIGAGRAVQTRDGYVLTLRQRIFDHYLTSMATLKKAVAYRTQLQRYTHYTLNPRYLSNPAINKLKTKAYIFPPTDSSSYLYDVLEILDRHGITLLRSSEEFTVEDAQSYELGTSTSRTFPAGTYVVPADQNRFLFIHTLLQRNMEIEDSVMYDMSTWSAPMAYNLEAYMTDTELTLSGDTLKSLPTHDTGVKNPDATYAYVIDWNQRYAPRALAFLWEKGYRVRSAKKAFTTQVDSFSPGSLIVLIGRNQDYLSAIKTDMLEIAQQAKVRIVGLNTGRMQSGIDLASRDSEPIKQPRVAMLVDPPFSMYETGQLYFLFDWETRLPLTRLRPQQLSITNVSQLSSRYGLADLEDLDVLIIPGSKDLDKIFDHSSYLALNRWVSNGGTCIMLTESVAALEKEVWDMSYFTIKSAPKDTSEEAKVLKYADREKYVGLRNIPGAAMNSVIDTSHPLAFGVKSNLFSLKFGTQAIIPHASVQSVGRYHDQSDQLLAAGYASIENQRHLAGKTFAAVIQKGEGKIVCILDNMQYRMFWRGGSRMLQNAVMLLPGM